MKNTFECQNCKFSVKTDGNIGTRNRNHCPKCLYSKHVDERKPGDRGSGCKGLMKPKGIVFKKDKVDKYGKEIEGEAMILHECVKCKKEDKNRIAGDDNEELLLKLCNSNENLERLKKQLFGYSKNEL